MLLSSLWLWGAVALSSSQPTLRASGLVVHEWGTFTTVMAPSGTPVMWRPFRVDDDLPSFVYDTTLERQEIMGVRQQKSTIEALVRMETPVVYFHTDAETPVPVTLSVQYPKGLLTEWCPQAAPSEWGEALSWRVQVLPRAASPVLPDDGAGSHYYAARAVAANAVQAVGSTEVERFLFYRGVGNAPPELTAREADAGAGTVAVVAAGRSRGEAILFSRAEGGPLCWSVFGATVGAPVVPPSLSCGPQASLEGVLVARLLAEGLYRDEAEAMVATWRHHWFVPGTRVLSVVPRETVDRLLPLQVTPAPQELVRVMVERTELIRSADVARLRGLVAAGAGESEIGAVFGRLTEAVVAASGGILP